MTWKQALEVGLACTLSGLMCEVYSKTPPLTHYEELIGGSDPTDPGCKAGATSHCRWPLANDDAGDREANDDGDNDE